MAENTRTIVFDFDGVIIPSEEIKIEGYSLIFSEFGEEVPERAIEEARREFVDAKGDRYDIIRSIFKRTGREGDIEKAVAEYAERYGAIVKKRIMALRVEEQVRTTLGNLAKRFPLYINSNNPDEFLRGLLRTLGVEVFFKGIYGSSHTKLENLQAIAREEDLKPEEIIFVGDGEGDRTAAEDFGCEFIGIATSLNGWSETDSFRVIISLSELETT
ncbi:HAD family hydrolase [Candidatus Kaiserbacteria bacterium]|nr:HAD family hydrolase [Candidatus Kaiserbacteria bacterium]